MKRHNKIQSGTRQRPHPFKTTWSAVRKKPGHRKKKCARKQAERPVGQSVQAFIRGRSMHCFQQCRCRCMVRSVRALTSLAATPSPPASPATAVEANRRKAAMSRPSSVEEEPFSPSHRRLPSWPPLPTRASAGGNQEQPRDISHSDMPLQTSCPPHTILHTQG